jgi:hypothetical protein
MSEFVGVTHFINLSQQTIYGGNPLKQQALMFDKIAIANLYVLLRNRREFIKELNTDFRDIDWLLEQGVVVEAEKLLEGKKLVRTVVSDLYHELTHLQHELLRQMEKKKRNTDKKRARFINFSAETGETEARFLSLLIRQSLNLEAYPIINKYPSPLVSQTNKSEVLEIVLKKLPAPDELTPWEQLLEFRDDADSRYKFLALREWASEIARMKLAPSEVEQKLEFLIASYEDHMRLHKIKTRLTTLKTIVLAESGFITGGWLTGLGALPGIIGMVAAPLYSIRQHKLSLLEEERKAPGKEIAYIIKARETF